MSRRRVSNGDVKEIGAERIDRLLDLSEEAARGGEPGWAKRYVELARDIGGKTRVKMPKDRKYCKNCHQPLLPGVNCRTRLSNHKVCITCDMCGEVRRIPYIREQKS